MAGRQKNRAIERLERALAAIPELRENRGLARSSEFEKWHRDTEIAISHTFGEGTRHVKDFTDVGYWPVSYFADRSSDYQGNYLNGLDSASSVLQSMIDEIKEYWGDDTEADVDTGYQKRVQVDSSNEFVVHGRDEGAKQAVARFLEKLELSPIILHEQPNQGQTIIEKFEEHSNVGFAVVLLTPDDVGGPADEGNTQRPRARQNVILELGFFLGKLGRERTCALLVDDVEIPSDYDGVLYIPMDGQGAWMMNLVRELKGAGLEVDANLAFGV